MIFDYAPQEMFTKQLDLVDPGNTAIRGNDARGSDYYMILKTIMGKTAILKFGPVLADSNILIEDFDASFKKLDYNERKIGREINNFLNDYKKQIIDVQEILVEEVFNFFPNLKETFNNL